MSETISSKTYIDAHCHLADPKFGSDLDNVLTSSIQSGVGEWIQGGISPDDWLRQQEIRKLWPTRIHLAFGLHPWWIAQHSDEEVESGFQKLTRDLGQATLLGELGLDYLPRFATSKERQIRFFEKQLDLNQTHQKPLVLHVVHAHSDSLRILEEKGETWRGLVHAFSEGKEIAKRYLDLGLFISVGGACTRIGFNRLKESLHFIPDDRLVIETDAPDQTPEVGGLTRANRNEPRYLLAIAAQVAQIKKTSPEAVLDQSRRNLKSLLVAR